MRERIHQLAVLVIVCAVRQEVRLQLRCAVIILTQNSVPLREEIGRQVDLACRIPTVNALDSRITVRTSADVQKAA